MRNTFDKFYCAKSQLPSRYPYFVAAREIPAYVGAAEGRGIIVSGDMYADGEGGM